TDRVRDLLDVVNRLLIARWPRRDEARVVRVIAEERLEPWHRCRHLRVDEREHVPAPKEGEPYTLHELCLAHTRRTMDDRRPIDRPPPDPELPVECREDRRHRAHPPEDLSRWAEALAPGGDLRERLRPRAARHLGGELCCRRLAGASSHAVRYAARTGHASSRPSAPPRRT